jgi:excisionase family DNA binding protein
VNQAAQGTVSVQEILAYIERDRYMSLNDAVRYLPLSERTLRERLRQIPHYRVGAKLLFRKSEFDGWMQKHREQSPALDLDRLAEEALKGVIRRAK